MSKQHGTEMLQPKGSDYPAVLEELKKLITDPASMQARFGGKRKEFGLLPSE